MVAAALRADTTDLRSFLDVLAAKLTDALPGHVNVQLEPGLFKKDKRVQSLRVALDSDTYQLRWNHESLEPTINNAVLPLDNWMNQLWKRLRDQARTTSEGRAALSQLISGQAPAQNIARDPADRGRLLSRLFDPEIAAGSQLAVDGDETAVFVSAGSALGSLGPGTWTLDPGQQPFLAPVADPESGQMRCSLYFVSAHEVTNLPFGGMVDNVADPETGLAVGLRVFGDYSLQVVDPLSLVLRLGAQDVVSDEQVTDWMRDQLLKVLRTGVAAHIGAQGWPILGIAAHTDELEKETLERVNSAIKDYGLGVMRIGNFTISMKEDDEANLKRYRTEMQMRRLGAPDAAAPVAAAETVPALDCAACGTRNLASAKFCSNCGKPLLATCPACATANQPGARFCSNCGQALS